MTPDALDCSVIIPTVGRPGLQALVDALATPPTPREVIVVDDRSTRRAGRLRLAAPDRPPTRVVAGPGRGPAAARNVGLRLARAAWVAFLDDDVRIDPQWTSQLAADLARADTLGAAGVQGALAVPLPSHRRPTDWERQVAGLAAAAWVTADMAYRRDVLVALGGFDERFTRAFREDAELAGRLRRHGYRLIRGHRRTTHPVGPAGFWVSVRRQAGNADDALLQRLYGPQWRKLCSVPPGRRRRHALVTAAGALAVVAWLARARRPAALAALAWLAGTAEFAARRILPGPRTPGEVVTMAVTSVAIPPLAVGHYLRGWLRHRGARPVPAVRASTGMVEVRA
jgi:glycosyltransferase involved in cell wall biosynthesis